MRGRTRKTSHKILACRVDVIVTQECTHVRNIYKTNLKLNLFTSMKVSTIFRFIVAISSEMFIKEEQKKEEISGKETTEHNAFCQKSMNIFSKHFDTVSWAQTIVLFIFGFTIFTLLIHAIIIFKDLKKNFA